MKLVRYMTRREAEYLRQPLVEFLATLTPQQLIDLHAGKLPVFINPDTCEVKIRWELDGFTGEGLRHGEV